MQRLDHRWPSDGTPTQPDGHAKGRREIDGVRTGGESTSARSIWSTFFLFPAASPTTTHNDQSTYSRYKNPQKKNK